MGVHARRHVPENEAAKDLSDIQQKLLEIDERGKVRLSRKAALEEREAAEEEA